MFHQLFVHVGPVASMALLLGLLAFPLVTGLAWTLSQTPRAALPPTASPTPRAALPPTASPTPRAALPPTASATPRAALPPTASPSPQLLQSLSRRFDELRLRGFAPRRCWLRRA